MYGLQIVEDIETVIDLSTFFGFMHEASSLDHDLIFQIDVLGDVNLGILIDDTFSFFLDPVEVAFRLGGLEIKLWEILGEIVEIDLSF